MKHIKKIIVLAFSLVMILSLAACANNNNEATQDNGTAESNASTENGELLEGGAISIGVASAISTLDTNQEAGILNYQITAIVSEGLVGLDNNGQAIPALATSWETEDYATWTFHLREDAVFHNGDPVTVDDVIWSVERAQDPAQSPGVAFYFPDWIEEVNRIDDYTIEFVLDQPHPAFVWAVANVGGLFVTSQAWAESVDAIGSSTDLIIGSGPYQVTEFSPGSHVTLVANENWWGGAVTVPEIRFDFITDNSTRLLAFSQGSLDLSLSVPLEQGEQWANVDGAEVLYFSDRSYYGLTIDVTVAPFDNEHVRKAVAYAVNAQGIVDSILGGHATVATAITPPEQFASAISVSEAAELLANVTHFTYNMAQAQSEFEAAGVDSFSVTIHYPDSFPTVGRASLVIADALTQIGIEASVAEVTLDQWLTTIGDGENGIGWMIYSATTPQPQEIVSWLLAANGPGTNPANFSDEEIAAIIADLATRPIHEGIDELILAHDLAQAQAIYVPVWWGQQAIAWNQSLDVTDFNSFTLLSENWPTRLGFGN